MSVKRSSNSSQRCSDARLLCFFYEWLRFIHEVTSLLKGQSLNTVKTDTDKRMNTTSLNSQIKHQHMTEARVRMITVEYTTVTVLSNYLYKRHLANQCREKSLSRRSQTWGNDINWDREQTWSKDAALKWKRRNVIVLYVVIWTCCRSYRGWGMMRVIRNYIRQDSCNHI